MKKLYIVKHKYDFDRIIKQGNKKKNDIFIIYSENNNLKYARYGISVGKKLGNAVYRNKKKRQLRSIIDNLEKDYVKTKDYIIILREKGKQLDYQELNKKLKSLIIERKDQR
jgi:ribonuclease P protein component